MASYLKNELILFELANIGIHKFYWNQNEFINLISANDWLLFPEIMRANRLTIFISNIFKMAQRTANTKIFNKCKLLANDATEA